VSDQPFDTPLALSGPFRAPKQMLETQEYGGHAQYCSAQGLLEPNIVTKVRYAKFGRRQSREARPLVRASLRNENEPTAQR